MGDLRIGTAFSSYEELDRKIKEFSEKNFVHFYKREARTLRGVAHKIKKVVNANKNLIYYTLKYTCVFGGRAFIKNRNCVGLRVTKTSKLNCGAYIRCSLTADLQHLEIADMKLNHNHEVSEELYRNHCIERRLPKEVQQKVASLLHLHADKRLIQKQIMMETGKIVNLKDLSNISWRFKNTIPNLGVTVKLLLESYNTHISMLEDDSGTLIGVFFQDDAMVQVFEKNPQVLILDNSYSPASFGFFYNIFFATDDNGETEIIGIGLLASEDDQSVSWLVDSFKKCNTVWNQTHTLLIDKDFESIFAKEFNEAKIFFLDHGSKTFNREITFDELNLSEQQQEIAKVLFKQLCVTETEVEYWELYEKLVIDVPLTLLHYFDANWHQIREQWTMIAAQKVGLNLESNKSSEIQSKLEICMCSSSLTDFIKEFFVTLYCMRDEKNPTALDHVLNRPALTFNKNTPAAFYQALLKPYAFKSVFEQLESCKKDDVQLLSNDVFVYTEENNYMLVDESTCSCSFNVGLRLPCRHIFAVRLHLRESLFDRKLCDESWIKGDLTSGKRKKTPKKVVSKRLTVDPLVETQEVQDTSQESIAESETKEAEEVEILTKEERYEKSIAIANRLADVMCEAEGAEFQRRMELVRDLVSKWEEKKDLYLLDISSQQNVFYLVPTTNPPQT